MAIRTAARIQRMGNPLFNELIIGTGAKDRFSMSAPAADAQFANFALDPVLAAAYGLASASASMRSQSWPRCARATTTPKAPRFMKV